MTDVAELAITVGIPGCGKSAWASKKEIAGAYILSSDTIRAEIAGNVTDQSKNGLVFKTLHERLKDRLDCGWETIVDATNLKRKSRLPLWAIGKGLEVSCTAYRFGISEDYDECQRRNLGRERVVPEDVMKRFHNDFLNNCSLEQLQREGWTVVEVAR